jgi:hypothetical protein
MLRRTVTIAALIMALARAANAGASAQDVAATHAYIRADYAVTKASVALIDPGQAKIEALNSRLAHECPKAGKGTPQDETAQAMSYDVADALWSLSYGTVAAPIRTFVAAVRRLHWSSPHITSLAHKYASDLHELSMLPLPDLCSDVRAWTASGFQVVPANVLALDQRVEAIQPEPVPAKLFAPFERGSDASMEARAHGFEDKLAETEFVIGQDDWLQILETLGLPG